MLKGTFKYEGYTFKLRGYDFGDYVSLYLSCPLTKAKLLVDKGFEYSDGNVDLPRWEDFYINIGQGAVKADCYIELEGDKKVKNSVNSDLICRLANTIRGMKAGCNNSNKDNGDDLFNIGFNPMKVVTYRYNSDSYIKLDLKIIRELVYKGDDGVSLELKEDNSFTETVWQLGSTTHRFKLDLSEFTQEDNSDDSWDFDTDKSKIFSLQEIIEKNPDKSYVWLKERKYYIVKDIKDVEKVCKKIWQHKGIVAFDTETTGLNVNITSRTGGGDRLVGMVFSIEPGVAYYFPIKHKKVQNICNDGNENYIIEKYFKPILEKKDILCHNGSYDWKVMYNYGICINLKHDTYILFKVTFWNDHRNLALNLKSLTSQFLGRDSFTLSDFVVGKFDSELVKFWDLEEESVKYYACPDTDNLLELFDYAMQQDLLGKYEAKKIYQIEVLFSIVIAYQEYYGHCVDVDNIESLIQAITRDKEESYKRLVEIAGRDFNPKSSPDMQKVCFDILKLPIVDLTDAGNPSTGKDTRKAWLESSKTTDEQKEFVKCLNIYLDARTLESNFTKNIDKFATEDGLMFSEVQQFLETGRVSTKEPNYQGYSDTVKKYIVPRSGYYSADADYSSVEARIMCSMAGCDTMVERLKDPDMDYHRLKASDMFGVPYELVTDDLRKMSKGVNFGILYCMGDPNLGGSLYGTVSPENTRKAAKQRKLYFTGMEGLESFIEKSKAQGREKHFSKTFFKRRRYYDTRVTRIDTIERQSCNARIQGTAADIYKIGMIRLFTEIKNRGWLGKVLISAFVHDECFLEIHKSINPFVLLKVLRKSMMLEMEGWCPLFIGAGFGETWYEAKHTEIPIQVQEDFECKYGETGIDWWDGDTRKFCNYVVDSIMNYKRDRVLNYIKNEDNWHKVFQPTENELCHELLKDIAKGQVVEGAITAECNPSDDMIENLKEFCRVFDCMDIFEKCDIQKPVQKESSLADADDAELLQEEDVDPKKALQMRVNMLGVHSVKRSDSRKLYFKYIQKDSVFMNMVHKTMVSMPGDVEVFALKDDGEIYSTGLKVNIKVYPKLLNLYISRASINKARG